jgi:beta-glucosidase
MERIEKLLAEMTLEEKVSMAAGSDAWHSTGVGRLGVPTIKMTDGPNGARGDAQSGCSAVCFPVGSALAATWNPDLLEQVGTALGQEALSKGAQVLLGPTVNIHRTPLGGRNFECYSEDPFLTARMAVAFVKGVQSQGVGCSVKHFVCNDSEFERFTISSEVGERALREIYLVPFEAAVKEAGVWSVMAAYNRIGGTYACAHRELLTDILKREWEFEGFVVSDWGASKNTREDAVAGLDLEMPGPARIMGEQLLAAAKAGEVDEATIDDKVRRLLRVTILSGRMDDPEEKQEQSLDRPEHRALARRAATESMVLVKNRGVLPLDARALRSLAVIGPNAALGQIQGGGSSGVKPHYEVHPLEAIREHLGQSVSVRHEPGCRLEKWVRPFEVEQLRPTTGEDGPGFSLEYWDNRSFEGEPIVRRVVHGCRAAWFGGVPNDVGTRDFSARYSATFTPARSGAHTFGLMSTGLSRLLLDGHTIIDNWSSQRPGDGFFGHSSAEERAEVELRAGRSYEIRVDFEPPAELSTPGIQFGVTPPEPEDLMELAVAAARDADAAIVVVGTSRDWETEGNDRTSMELPGRQPELIAKVCAANPNSVVVTNAGSPIAMDWLDRVPALLHAWFPGQEFGHALADLLFGDANPSGKLPTTFPVRLQDTPAFTNYPGENNQVVYGEGLFVGYRWYDARDITPRLPFGHGLSYTSFAYGELSVAPEARAGEPIEASLEIANRGERAGQEVVQLYVRDPLSRLARPEKELKAFAKVSLEPGQSTRVSFVLDDRALACWDPSTSAWVAEPGEFELLAGSSSRDIRSRAGFVLRE